MAQKSGIPLSSIANFPEEILSLLAAYWITTAEELVAAALTEEGPLALSQALNIPIEKVNHAVELAQNALPAGVSFDTRDVQSFGLGALDEAEDDDSRPSARLSFAPLPEQVDLRNDFPAIQNQGQRGTCVAFATTAVREYLLAKMPGYKNLSEQHLYWNCKQHDGVSGAGTYISVAMERLLADGQCPEETWPYNPLPIAGNEGQSPPPADAREKGLPQRISETRRIPARSVADLKQALADGQPVAFAVPVFTYWFMEPLRRSGDIRLPFSSDRQEGGHAMTMVGYQDDPEVPGGGYFHIRNSWGTSWASESLLGSGYARLPYAYMQYYGNAAHTASVSVLPEPQPEEKKKGFFARLWDFIRRLFGG
ncbi:MAG: C1 family peptidase [Chloroflexota bacterium]|jgi:C1A family cysteine protease